MITLSDAMKKRWRFVYHMTPFGEMTDTRMDDKTGLTFECNGDLCDVLNSFMANHQYAFKDYLIQIDYILELPDENG